MSTYSCAAAPARTCRLFPSPSHPNPNICIDLYICICTHIQIHVYVYIHAYVYTYLELQHPQAHTGHVLANASESQYTDTYIMCTYICIMHMYRHMRIYMCLYLHSNLCLYILAWRRSRRHVGHMGWLRLVGSYRSFTELQVSFAKEPYKRGHIMQKRPVILRSLLIVATPHPPSTHATPHPPSTPHSLLQRMRSLIYTWNGYD